MPKNVSIKKPEPEGPPAFPAELLAEAHRLISRRTRLLETEARLVAELEAAITTIAGRRMELGDLALDAVLDGNAPNGASNAAQQALEKAQRDRIRFRALLGRCRWRLERQGDAISELIERFDPAFRQWRDGVWADFASRRLSPAIERFRETLAEGRRLAAALGIAFRLEDYQLDTPAEPPDAAHSAPFLALTDLRRFDAQVRSREKEQALYRQFDTQYPHVSIDPDALYAFRRTQAAGGREFPAGAVVGADSLHPGLLRRLLAARWIVPVESAPAQEARDAR